MTRLDLCAGGDGPITWQLTRYDPGWAHLDGSRFNGHAARPTEQCPECGSPLLEAADPWSERCRECGTTIDTSKEMS